MNSSQLSHVFFVSVVIAAILLIRNLTTHAYADDQQQYQICSSPIHCANIQEMRYPFWGSIRPDYCGHPAFQLKSCSEEFAEITIMSLTYRVLQVNQTTRTLRVARTDYWNNLCPAHLVNSTLDAAHFDAYVKYFDYIYFHVREIVVLYYDCRTASDQLAGNIYPFECDVSHPTRASNSNYFAYPGDNYTVPSCKQSVLLNVSSRIYDFSSDKLVEALNDGYELKWKANNRLCDDCQASGGQCGYDSSSSASGDAFICHCKDKSYPITCESNYKGPYDERYLNCIGSSFQCAYLYNVSYPFWIGNKLLEYCGLPDFKLDCSSDYDPEITIMSKKYLVYEINQTSHTLIVAMKDFYDTYVCPANPARNLTSSFMGSSFSEFSSDNQNVTIFYNCRSSSFNASVEINTSYVCNYSSESMFNFAVVTDDLIRVHTQTTNNGIPLGDVIRNCSGSAVVPVLRSDFENYWIWIRHEASDIDYFLHRFSLEWKLPEHATTSRCDDCERSGGLCGYNPSSRDNFSCYCRDGPSPRTCAALFSELPFKRDHSAPGSSSRHKLAIGISAALFGLVITTILILSYKRGSLSSKLVFLKKEESTDGFNVEAFMESHGPFAPKRYTYADVRKMTNSFSEKLGRGGFGSVYKGKLSDGSLVAVKVLKESKSNGEEFINEVASIGRTSHVNIVTLFGFCYERNKRALIYEYMPNGSLDKFIFNKENKNIRLEWKILYDIAIGIARGLEYLHRGCTTRILHLDIKPHNILLDKDFGPKISDFGLAKLCPREESVVSMLGARGTFGYVAPEVYCRNFGGVSYKSDVYSYGMMVLEMVGGRKNIDVSVSRTSEIYFPDWMFTHINDGGEKLEIGEEMTNEEEEMARKMILVSLWCIQAIPGDRPSMTKVVEMLEGSVQSLQIPPKPTLSFPTEKFKNHL